MKTLAEQLDYMRGYMHIRKAELARALREKAVNQEFVDREIDCMKSIIDALERLQNWASREAESGRKRKGV